MENIIRILVTSAYDDCGRILDILSEQNDFFIAGVEKDASGTIIKSANMKPDVLILDLQSSEISGDKLAPIIHRRSPDTAIILLCDKDEDIYAGLALKAGISGFLLKGTDTDKLVPVIRIVSNGGYFISASIIIRVFTAVTFMYYYPAQIPEQKNERLNISAAERSIIIDIAKGFTDADIAKHLNFSIGSIKNCVLGIKRKTNLNSRIQIVIYSLVCGLIRFDQIGIIINNRQVFNNLIQ